MLRVAILDANTKSSATYKGLTSSVVGQWLGWECQQAGIEPTSVGDADVVFLVFAGSVDWRAECRKELKRRGIKHETDARGRKPYIIAGGPIDVAPFTATAIADAVAIGEAYRFVRGVLELVRTASSIAEIHEFCEHHPHCLTAAELDRVPRDPEQPHLLAEAGAIASPDTWIDWDVPPIKSDDNVVRLIASKGCHFKCAFCSTTFRQPYLADPHGGRTVGRLEGLHRAGERVQLLSNDPMNLSYFKKVSTRLDSQSFTIAELRDRDNREALIRNGVRIARFGVEGLSERIRRAFGKTISNDELVDLLGELHRRKVNTHMFYIINAPYEQAVDWMAFRELWERLSKVMTWGICRVKFTTFIPAAPAPLARFIPGSLHSRRMEQLQDWVVQSCASKNMLVIPGRVSDSHWENVSEQFGMPKQWGLRFFGRQETTDLAPDLDMARRLPWEIIEWPIPVEKRYKASEVYRRRMESAA
jgi:hypothetical protein